MSDLLFGAPQYEFPQNWNQDDRLMFYSQDQGSRLIPLRWYKSLRLKDSTLFSADKLKRYGYIENILNRQTDLPIRFTVSHDANNNT